MLKVIKFGGSSVGSAHSFSHVGHVLQSHRESGSKVVCVLSAMFGVTNQLIGAVNAAAKRDMESVDAKRSRLLCLHEDCIDQMPLTRSTRWELREYTNKLLEGVLDPTCEEVAEGRNASAYHMDLVSCLGERLSNRFMAGYLKDHGIKAEDVQADEVLVTNGVSGGSECLLDESTAKIKERLNPMLDDGIIPCFTGFIGASQEGKLTTLGRGGSDLTAAVVGYALDAQEIILSKVEYTTKPSGWMDEWEEGWVGVVHHANVQQTLRHITYLEAAELAHFQRKVLHHGAVFPAIDKDIPLRVANTLEFTNPGTLIGPLPKEIEGMFASPVREVTSVEMKEYESKTGMKVNFPRFLTSTSRDSMDPEHHQANPDETIYMVAVIGENVKEEQHKVKDQIIEVLSERNIDFEFPILKQERPNSEVVVVTGKNRRTAVQALHAKFIGDPDVKRWLIPSPVPVTVESKMQSAKGAGFF